MNISYTDSFRSAWTYTVMNTSISSSYLLLIVCILLTGCSTPYGVSYRPLLDKQDERLVNAKSIEHEWVENMQDESIEMHQRGYAMVGYSYMCGAHLAVFAPPAAKNWGRKLKAEKVLQYKDGCLYLATYWRQIRGFSLGAFYEDAPTTAHQAYGIEAGVIIQNIVSNSAAEAGQLMPGDLLLAIDDEIIPSAHWLDDALAAKQGQVINLTVWPMRDIEPMTLAIALK